MKTKPFVMIAFMALASVSAISALARDPAPDYADLTLKQAAPKPEFIIDGADWLCQGLTCHAAVVEDMPALRSCQRIVPYTGAFDSFIWRGKALSAADIATCNTRARS